MANQTNQPKQVRWPISMSVIVMALAAMLTLTTITRADVVFSDGEFNLADWQVEKFFWGNGGSITPTQRLSGGNPGKFLEIDHYVQTAGADPSVVYGLHTRNGATYDPAGQGEIIAVDFSIDYKNFQTTAAGVAFGLGLKQDGKIYQICSEVSGTIKNWQTEIGFGLSQTSFGLWTDIGYSFIADFSQNPDFSSAGSPIEFGFFTSNSNIPYYTALVENIGFDNWTVSIHPVPEPTMFAFLALGSLFLKTRRKL